MSATILTSGIVQQWTTRFAPADACTERAKPRAEAYAAAVQLQLLRHRGTPILTRARLRNLSETGIGLFLREPINAGELVDLRFNLYDVSYTVRARIVHCTQIVGWYEVGFQFIFSEAY